MYEILYFTAGDPDEGSHSVQLIGLVTEDGHPQTVREKLYFVG